MTRNAATDLFEAFREFATQAQEARVVDAATDGDDARTAAVVAMGGTS